MTKPKLFETVRQTFEELTDQGLPGAIIGVCWPSGEYVRAFGVADLATSTPMRVDMRSRIGSVSKLVVAHVTLRLIDEGILGLDSAISAYVDDVPNGSKITLRHLGQHRSGLREPLENRSFRSRLANDPKKPIPLDDTLAAAFELSALASPGELTAYSNANALLLAKACEAATGQPFPALADRYLADPLGLVPWRYEEESDTRGYRYAGRHSIIAYGTNFIDASHVNPAWSGAAGAFTSEVDDLLKLAPYLIGGEGLSASSRTILTDFAPPDRWGNSFGFLLAKTDRSIGHAGDIHGYSAFLARDLTGQRTVAVMANLANLKSKSNPAQILGLKVLDQLRED
ncbi:MAG: serine hydrolase domain-containing protein [Pseudomonadota bacterium]